MFQGHIRGLSESDTMLTRERTPQIASELKDLVHCLCHALNLF
jgi:hypothetical protein